MPQPNTAVPHQLDVRINGTDLRLLPGGGVFFESERTLFVADLHLGKDTTFRKHGLSVPAGCTTATLGRVTRLIDQTRPDHLYFLGDMFHARSSLSSEVIRQVNEFCQRHMDVTMTLVRGNHESGFRNLPSSWSIELIEEGSSLGPLLLCHHPVQPDSASMISLAGHVHPSFRFQSRAEQLGRVPCFWYSRQTLVLPAIGQFTGTYTVSLKKADRIWLSMDDSVIEVGPNSASSRSGDR